MCAELDKDSWPPPLQHCSIPFLSPADEDVVIAEISGEAVNGFPGNRMLFTALVPLDEVDSVLKTTGGIGHGVNFASVSVFNQGNQSQRKFSIWGADSGKNFESLIHTWRDHNKTVILPDSSFLAQYGLVPRQLSEGRVSWDSLDVPTYDVVRVMPMSTYSAPLERTTARVVVRRDYLEDYLSLKACAAVITFWEERFSSDDPEIENLIGSNGSHIKQPGREIWFLRARLDDFNQVSQVWGCTLLLKPTSCPITRPAEVELCWPDRSVPIRGTGVHGKFEPFENTYVRDEVLLRFEKHSEFNISPEDGFVSYEGRWSVDHCRRMNRNFIRVELRKLYEGAPFEVVKHYYDSAVSETVAKRDSSTHGERHIGVRARDLVAGFLKVTNTVTALGDAAGLFFTQEEVGQLSSAGVRYRGWWTIEGLKPLGHVIPLTMAFPDFLARCAEIFKLFENLKPGPLRQILIHLGLKKGAIDNFQGLKLLASLGQLSSICEQEGLDLVSDRSLVSAKWDTKLMLPEFHALFALFAMRTLDAHKRSSEDQGKLTAALNAFQIDEAACRGGWGRALDAVYDKTAESLESINRLIGDSWNRIAGI